MQNLKVMTKCWWPVQSVPCHLTNGNWHMKSERGDKSALTHTHTCRFTFISWTLALDKHNFLPWKPNLKVSSNLSSSQNLKPDIIDTCFLSHHIDLICKYNIEEEKSLHHFYIYLCMFLLSTNCQWKWTLFHVLLCPFVVCLKERLWNYQHELEGGGWASSQHHAHPETQRTPGWWNYNSFLFPLYS